MHIVAAKKDMKNNSREGKEVVEKGDFVKEGDLLITGIYLLKIKHTRILRIGAKICSFRWEVFVKQYTIRILSRRKAHKIYWRM